MPIVVVVVVTFTLLLLPTLRCVYVCDFALPVYVVTFDLLRCCSFTLPLHFVVTRYVVTFTLRLIYVYGYVVITLLLRFVTFTFVRLHTFDLLLYVVGYVCLLFICVATFTICVCYRLRYVCVVTFVILRLRLLIDSFVIDSLILFAFVVRLRFYVVALRFI